MASGPGALVSWGTNATGQGSTVLLQNGNQVRFAGVGDDAIFTLSGSYADGRWHHIVVTYAGATNVVSLYYDGALVGSQALAASLNTVVSPAGMLIGHDTSGANQFIGAIDEVAVYTKTLSAAAVASHAALGRQTGLYTPSILPVASSIVLPISGDVFTTEVANLATNQFNLFHVAVVSNRVLLVRGW